MIPATTLSPNAAIKAIMTPYAKRLMATTVSNLQKIE